MKKKLSKHLRRAAMITSLVIVGISSVLLYTQEIKTDFQEEKIAVYEYTKETDANYQVALKSNDVYQSRTIGEGKHLITTFVDQVDTTFQYNFQGESSADITGQYDIMAVVEGYTGENEQYKTLWNREFPIMEAKTFETNNSEFEIKENVSLKLKEYNDFVSEFIDQTGVSSQVKLSLMMNVDLEADTPKGMIQETATPSIEIPLNVNGFEITKSGVGQETGAIEEVQTLSIPPNTNVIILYGTIIVVSLIGLIYLFFFTVSVMSDPLEKYLKRLFKHHGNRLVALNNELAITCETTFNVHSIEDLVKIADEIEKPILYQHKSSLKDIQEFYVFEEQCVYVFHVGDIVQAQKETPKSIGKSSSQNKIVQEPN